MLPDFDARWEDAALRKDLLDVARALESESSVIGVSSHLLGIGKKRRQEQSFLRAQEASRVAGE